MMFTLARRSNERIEKEHGFFSIVVYCTPLESRLLGTQVSNRSSNFICSTSLIRVVLFSVDHPYQAFGRGVPKSRSW